MSKYSDDEDIIDFLKMFNVVIDDDKRFLSQWDTTALLGPLTATDEIKVRQVPAIQLTISHKQLIRLVKILKGKGYFHDDDYQIKLNEEELILSNPELKKLHDQYKMYLYMLNDTPYNSNY